MKTIKIAAVIIASGMVLGSCTKDLNRNPEVAKTASTVYTSEAGYRSSLAKIYGGLALTGNSGPAGDGDLAGIDEGFSSYIRNYWNLQELPTEEAVLAWNDATIKDFHNMSWTPADAFLRAFYARVYFQITLANAFIREASDENLSSRGISGADAEKVRLYKQEARFLRALSYYHALDLFGNPTFVTETDPIGAFIPQRISRAELYKYVESELKDLEGALPAPKGNEYYTRADKASVWMLLANLYLNAGVYTGTPHYDLALSYSKKVIDAGYTLDPSYAHNFLADNQTSPEVIFAVAFDGNKTRTYGGTTYLVHAPVGGDMDPTSFGIDGGWGGLRTTSTFVNKFDDPSGATDTRAMFFSAGQTLEINDISNFRDGYGITKWKNRTSTGAPGSNPTFPDTDFPMFRLAEAYLIYAEAVLRGAPGGTNAEALGYINALRARAYGNNSGNITAANLTLNFILDERARELYWEGKRRTDLIRFDKFTTGSYVWPWKGGVKSGTGVGDYRKIYPIPSAEINSNPNLVQNTGY